MRTDELTPLWRSTIGFDRLFDFIEHQMRPFGDDSYPPYDIARVGEDNFRIILALPGYPLEALQITAEQNSLTVEGDVQQPDGQQFLYPSAPTASSMARLVGPISRSARTTRN